MKNLLFISLISFLLIGCSKEPDHSVRIVNELSVKANRLRFGDVRYDNLGASRTSEYKDVNEGDYILTALINGQPYSSDPVSIKGDGIYTWKVTIISLTQISLVEDSF